MHNLETLETGLLVTYRANAAKTDFGSIGHNKGAQNHALFVAYSKELKRRGVMNMGTSFDDQSAAAKLGSFNGPGSY